MTPRSRVSRLEQLTRPRESSTCSDCGEIENGNTGSFVPGIVSSPIAVVRGPRGASANGADATLMLTSPGAKTVVSSQPTS